MAAKFDTVIEVDEPIHVIHDTNLYDLEECPRTFYFEKLGQNLSLGWKTYPDNQHRLAADPRYKGSYFPGSGGEVWCIKGEYILSSK